MMAGIGKDKEFSSPVHVSRARSKDPISHWWSEDGIRKRKTPYRVEYVAVFLTIEQQQKLHSWWIHTIGPLLPDVDLTKTMHHMTLGFQPSSAQSVEERQLGREVEMEVVGYAQDEKGQVVVIKTLERYDGRSMPHVTVALDRKKGGRPVYSNSLLLQGYVDIQGPILKGVMGFVDQEQRLVFDIPWEKKIIKDGLSK